VTVIDLCQSPHGECPRRTAGGRPKGLLWVESECGAVALGRPYLFPPLSSGGALVARPWLRFHTPLIGRVGDWRAGLGRSLCSPLTRSFVKDFRRRLDYDSSKAESLKLGRPAMRLTVHGRDRRSVPSDVTSTRHSTHLLAIFFAVALSLRKTARCSACRDSLLTESSFAPIVGQSYRCCIELAAQND
jgi:hypothetical protein